MSEPLKIFISYSHANEKWKDKLLLQLKVLELHCDVRIWNDRDIPAGANWFPEIMKNLAECNVGIFLISASFLTSKFITEKELPPLLALRNTGKVRLIPILVEDCPWEEVEWLSKIQMLPRDGASVDDISKKSEKTKFFKNVALDIHSEWKKNEILPVNPEIIEKPIDIKGCELEETILDIITEEVNCSSQNRVIEELKVELCSIIKSTDVPFFYSYFTKYFDINDAEDSVSCIADGLIRKGLKASVDECLYQVCVDINPSGSSVDTIKDTMNDIMAILSVLEIDHPSLQRLCRKSTQGYHFNIEGVFTDVGVEIVMKRLGISSSYKPEIRFDDKNDVSAEGIININHDSVTKWHAGDTSNRFMVDIWNAVHSHIHQKTVGVSVRSYNQELTKREVSQLNFDIGELRHDPHNPMSFFVMYTLENERLVLETYTQLTKQLPELIAVAFHRDADTSVFINSDEAIIYPIRKIYILLKSMSGK